MFSIYPADADELLVAKNNAHVFALGKRYIWRVNGVYETREVLSDNFTVIFICDEADSDYPFVDGIRCENYDWCLNNYETDFHG